MMVTKVTEACQDHEKKWRRKKAEKQARLLSVLGKRTIEVEEHNLQEESNDELCNLDDKWEDSFDTSCEHKAYNQNTAVSRKKPQHKKTQPKPLSDFSVLLNPNTWRLWLYLCLRTLVHQKL